MIFKVKDQSVFLRLEERFRKKFEVVLNNKDFLNEVGEFAADRIRYQARVTKPLNSSGDFPDLKESSVKSRRYLAQHNAVDETFAAERSNLTITGQLLNSLKHVVKGAGLIAIEFTGRHTGYRTGGGKTASHKNKQIADWLSEKGFVVFDKSIKDNKQFRARIKSIALQYVRRAIAVSRRLGS